MMADREKIVDHEIPEQAASDISYSSGDETTVSEKRLLRKLDRRLLPGVSILYLLSFLDRSNVANARLDGLTTDLHMTGNEYLTGLTVFFIGYISLEVVWNIILKRIGPKIWLPAITFAWGIVATLQGIVVSKEGFYVVRTVLGITEGGLFPGYGSSVQKTKHLLTCLVSSSISPCITSAVRELIGLLCSSRQLVWLEPLEAYLHT